MFVFIIFYYIITSKDFSNISSLNNNLKNNYNALIEAIESLAITLLAKLLIVKEKKVKDICKILIEICVLIIILLEFLKNILKEIMILWIN